MNEHLDLNEIYLDQPKEIAIETMALCNARCTFCPYPTLERKGAKMSDELLEKLLLEMATYETPFFFSPFKVNEPLLDKRYFHVCHWVQKNTIAALRLFTNGAALTEKNCEKLATLERIKDMHISLNDYRPTEYEALMGIPFEKTASAIDELHAWQLPFDVILSTVGYPNEDFRKYCASRWPRFEARAYNRYDWLGFTWSSTDKVPDSQCSRWWELSIMADGVVSMCCMDGKGEYPIGDVNTQTMLEVYNSPYYRRHREQLASRHEAGADSPCSQCTYGG